MSIKLFILGRPGSGKSAAFRHLEDSLALEYKGWSITRYNDYDILYEMFLFEKRYLYNKQQKQFLASESEGFDVLDFTVLDTALVNLEKVVRARSSKKKDEIIVLEFARQDYQQALALFSPSFLKESYFLFLDTDVKTSVQRVKNRVTTPPTPDNHFVSENILTGYYGTQVIPPIIKTKKGEHVDRDRKRILSNRGSLQELILKIDNFIHFIIANSSPITQPHPIVQPKQSRIRVGIQHLVFFTFSHHKKASQPKVPRVKRRLFKQPHQKSVSRKV